MSLFECVLLDPLITGFNILSRVIYSQFSKITHRLLSINQAPRRKGKRNVIDSVRESERRNEQTESMRNTSENRSRCLATNRDFHIGKTFIIFICLRPCWKIPLNFQ
jgi:hypothetical protein